MKTVFCIALTGEGTTGSEWYYKKDDRDSAKGTTGAQSEVYFTIEVEDSLSRGEITEAVDAAEWEGRYIPEELK